MIVAAMQENWGCIKAHIARMVTIFEAIIRYGIEAGELKVEDPAEAARAVNTAFTPFFHPILMSTAFNTAKTPIAMSKGSLDITYTTFWFQLCFFVPTLGKPKCRLICRPCAPKTRVDED
jgi:hypothetical protein